MIEYFQPVNSNHKVRRLAKTFLFATSFIWSDLNLERFSTESLKNSQKTFQKTFAISFLPLTFALQIKKRKFKVL